MFSTGPQRRIWERGNLRTRYAPKSQVGRGLIQTAPWISLSLLWIFFTYLPMQHVIQPGVRIELPTTPLQAGSAFGPAAVVLEHDGKEIVFFNDQPYAIDVKQQRLALADAFRDLASQSRDTTLTIEADRNVRHGSMISIYNAAVEAGIGTVHLATRTDTRAGLAPQ